MSKSYEQQEFPQKNQRITVYWPNEDFWYIGTVISEMENGRLQIEYDEDNSTDWIDISVDKWRWATKHNKLVERKMKEKLNGLMIGSKLEIWWPHDREYFIGTLTNALTKGTEETNDRTEARSTTSNNPHHITYDDGDDEWTNLIYRKFKRVQINAECHAEQLQAGSRISVYDEEQTRYIRATIIEVNPNPKRGAKPHKIKYDEDGKGSAWLNLNIIPFLDIEATNKRAESKSVGHKRKHKRISDP